MKKKDTLLTQIMGLNFIIVIALWFGSYFVVTKIFGVPENAGIAGDLFGTIGSLFSGLAFVGVIWAIFLQRKALEIQHQDLIATLEEMKQTREAHEDSVKTLLKQVEMNELQTRVEILKTLIDVPLQVKGNSHLRGVHT